MERLLGAKIDMANNDINKIVLTITDSFLFKVVTFNSSSDFRLSSLDFCLFQFHHPKTLIAKYMKLITALANSPFFMKMNTYNKTLIIPIGKTKTLIFLEYQTLSKPVATAIISIINS